MPERPWLLAQTLVDQLFVHYRVPVARLQELVPQELEVEVHSGSGWLGVTAFAVEGLRLQGTIRLPLLSSYLELNVRTYVRRDDKPGIWFFSSDVSSRIVAEAARRLYRAPFFRATISSRRRGRSIHFECARDDGKAFSATYRSAGRAESPQPGSLEHFLTERYCLYTENRDHLYRAEIHHRPWSLVSAEAELELDTMAPWAIELGAEPLTHFSARQDVLVWPLERVA